jgi:spectinomycin phosphotransferase
MIIVKQLHAAVRDHLYNDPFEKQLAAFWKENYHEISLIVERTRQLGRILQSKPLEFVLCHADIHTANLLVGDQGNLFIVDWDQPVLAPRERDLMFATVGAYVIEQKAETLFFRGYGKTHIDPLAMAYYRYARVMEDLGGFAEPVFFMDVSDETREDSVKWFMAQFAPGGLVEAAHKLDHLLPVLG